MILRDQNRTEGREGRTPRKENEREKKDDTEGNGLVVEGVVEDQRPPLLRKAISLTPLCSMTPLRAGPPDFLGGMADSTSSPPFLASP